MNIFETGWESEETICGWGSELSHTEVIRSKLPYLFQKYNIQKINDAGCGDLNWIKHIDLSSIDYLGYDIVERQEWDLVDLECSILDITNSVMRSCDLIICRDVFIHLPNDIILKTLDMFKRSGRLLLSTSFEQTTNNTNRDIYITKHHQKLNLELAPFNLKPLGFKIPEDYPSKYSILYQII